MKKNQIVRVTSYEKSVSCYWFGEDGFSTVVIHSPHNECTCSHELPVTDEVHYPKELKDRIN